jgi:hypothetical protein
VQARPSRPKTNPALEGMLEAIAVLGKEGLTMWHEELDAMQGITNAQRTTAWAEWGERCKYWKLDPQALSNQIRATRGATNNEVIP